MKASTKRKVAQAVKPGAPALSEFNLMDYLDSPEAIAAYLGAAMDTNDQNYIREALGNVAKAHGMTEIAKSAHIARESLYKALGPNGNPSFATVMNVVSALGLKLTVAEG